MSGGLSEEVLTFGRVDDGLVDRGDGHDAAEEEVDAEAELDDEGLPDQTVGSGGAGGRCVHDPEMQQLHVADGQFRGGGGRRIRARRRARTRAGG